MSRDHGRAITRSAVTGAGGGVLDRFPTAAEKRQRIEALGAQITFFRDRGQSAAARELEAERRNVQGQLDAQLAFAASQG